MRPPARANAHQEVQVGILLDEVMALGQRVLQVSRRTQKQGNWFWWNSPPTGFLFTTKTSAAKRLSFARPKFQQRTHGNVRQR